jgi:hypothetical protein
MSLVAEACLTREPKMVSLNVYKVESLVLGALSSTLIRSRAYSHLLPSLSQTTLHQTTYHLFLKGERHYTSK